MLQLRLQQITDLLLSLLPRKQSITTRTVSAPEPSARSELAFGQAHTTAHGLRLSVLSARVEPAATAESSSTRLLLRARAENASAHNIEFDNSFGAIDGSGKPYTRTWVDPAKVPSVMPGLATLAPGESLEGDVFLTVSKEVQPPLYPAYLILLTGCGACPGSTDLVPMAMWEPVSINAS